MRAYTKEVVFTNAAGNYVNLASHFCPELNNAIKCPGRHVPDPFKENSKDGFRVVKDFNTSGKMIFNNNFGYYAGRYIDFFQYLALTKRVTDFYKALELVGNYLSCPRTGYFLKGQTRSEETAEQKAQREKAIEDIKKQSKIIEEQHMRDEKRRRLLNKNHINALLNKCVPLNSEKAQGAWEYLESRGLGALKNAPHELLKNSTFRVHNLSIT